MPISWPCSFVNKKHQRCVIVRSRHSPKGHQDAKGKIIGPGQYSSTFLAEKYKADWLREVLQGTIKLEQYLQQKEVDDSKDNLDPYGVRDFHNTTISQSFADIGDATRYLSHTTCFCCLKEIPRHGLPCGHVLCTACIRGFKCSSTDLNAQLDSCPLHPHDPFPEQWRIAFKPEYAGVRVLSLDGYVLAFTSYLQH